jgi:hypothetical protein
MRVVFSASLSLIHPHMVNEAGAGLFHMIERLRLHPGEEIEREQGEDRDQQAESGCD